MAWPATSNRCFGPPREIDSRVVVGLKTASSAPHDGGLCRRHSKPGLWGADRRGLYLQQGTRRGHQKRAVWGFWSHRCRAISSWERRVPLFRVGDSWWWPAPLTTDCRQLLGLSNDGPPPRIGVCRRGWGVVTASRTADCISGVSHARGVGCDITHCVLCRALRLALLSVCMHIVICAERSFWSCSGACTRVAGERFLYA